MFDFRELPFEFRPHAGARVGSFRNSVTEFVVPYDAADAVGIMMKAVEAPFVPYIDADEQATGDADREAADVYEGVEFVFPEVAERYPEVVGDHKGKMKNVKCKI